MKYHTAVWITMTNAESPADAERQYQELREALDSGDITWGTGEAIAAELSEPLEEHPNHLAPDFTRWVNWEQAKAS